MGNHSTPAAFHHDFGKGRARIASLFLPSTEIQLVLVIHLRQLLGSLIRVCTALRDSQIRCTREGQHHIN